MISLDSSINYLDKFHIYLSFLDLRIFSSPRNEFIIFQKMLLTDI